jgi:hypothetical protein
MRITIAIDLDIVEGKRPGTGYGRAERAAKAIGAFAQRLSAVGKLRSVQVRQPSGVGDSQSALMSFGPSQVQPLYWTKRL